MNFKKQAQKLESFLDEELRKNIPVLVLPDKTIVYKKFKIKQDKNDMWGLFHINGDNIDTFRLKSSALLAAKYYGADNFNNYNEVKILDSMYSNSASDSVFFRQRYHESKDTEKKELYLCRWDLTKARSEYYKKEISSMFSRVF